MEMRTFADDELPSFSEHLAVLPSFLLETDLRDLQAEIQSLTTLISGAGKEKFAAMTTRSFIPTHKKGGTIPYDVLRQHAPKAVSLYESPEYQDIISRIVGGRVLQTPLHHPSSLSVLVYDRPGDHINWHYDHNFYKGRFFTMLLALENRGHAKDGLSSACLLVRKGKSDVPVPTPPNMLVVFEGAKVLHRATQLKEGERRIVLSMTYSTDPRYSLFKEGMRRIKDIAFVGVRSLWS